MLRTSFTAARIRVQIGVVGDADRQIELPDLAVVMQDFADDFAI